MMPWIALSSWPVLSAVFYNRFTLPVALLATLLGGYLLLPNRASWNLPLLPVLNKHTIPVLAAIFLTMIYARHPSKTTLVLEGWVPRDPVIRVLLAVLILGIFLSVFANSDPLYFGSRFVPGVTLYDAFSQTMVFSLIIAPLFLARKVLASPQALHVLLLAFAVSGLIYTLPALYEVRMSPQLHATIYGVFPHSFAQHMRGGGFRPVVFLDHGLSLAIYFTFTFIAVCALYRISKGDNRIKWLFAVAWMAVTIVLVKSLGVLMICAMLVPLVLFCSVRVQLLAAFCIAIMFISYPALRSAQLIPVQQIMSFAETVNPARAASFKVRVDNEEALLERANERALFGWGGWGRNRIYDEYGRDVTISDGQWIIVLGDGGWVRYLSLYGLLTWPIIRMFLYHRREVDPVLAALSLILCAKLLDMLPNAGWSVPPWLIAGAILGRMELLENRQAKAGAHLRPEEPPPTEVSTGPRYARSFAKTSPPAKAQASAAKNTRYSRHSQSGEEVTLGPEYRK